MTRLVKRIATGAIAGFLATAPMTVAMMLMQRWFAPRHYGPLSPRQVTDNLTSILGLPQKTQAQHDRLTLAAHYSYGAAVGMLYPLLNSLPLPVVLTGAWHGLLVWAGSYLGLLPSTGLLDSATERPRRRNLLMITAHLIWGISLGAVYGLTGRAMRLKSEHR